jgi:hypothetical protein
MSCNTCLSTESASVAFLPAPPPSVLATQEEVQAVVAAICTGNLQLCTRRLVVQAGVTLVDGVIVAGEVSVGGSIEQGHTLRLAHVHVHGIPSQAGKNSQR